MRDRLDQAAFDVLCNLRHTDDQPLRAQLEDWQMAHIVRPALALTPQGGPKHKIVFCETFKGTGKSYLLAALALALCSAHRQIKGYCIAGDQDQATIIYEHAQGLVERTPALRGKVKVLTDRLRWDNDSSLRILASDAPTLHGLGGLGKGFLVIADEISSWRDRSLWDNLWSASGKLANTRFWIATNPGQVKAGLAWELHQLALKSGQPWVYGYAPGVAIQPKWIAKEWRDQMKASLPPSLFQRFALGQWADSDDCFVTRSEVEAATDTEAGEFLDPACPVHLGLDIGLRHDRSCLCAVCWRDGVMRLCALKVWTPSEQRSGEVLLHDIEQAILAVKARVPIRSLHFDAWQFLGTAQSLKAQGLPLTEFAMGAENQAKLAMTLRHAVTSRRLLLLPDKELQEELISLQVVPTSKPGQFRFDHRRSGYSDRAMALALAVYGADAAGAPSHIPPSELFQLGGLRPPGGLRAGLPYDRDGWSSAGIPEQDLADMLQEGPGGAFERKGRFIPDW